MILLNSWPENRDFRKIGEYPFSGFNFGIAMKKPSPICLLQEHALHSDYENRLKSVYTLLRTAENGFGIEDIHQFRVEIKKLKAFLSLLGTGRKKNAQPAISKELQKIYKVLGQIRVFQLQQEFIRKEIRETGIPEPRIYLDVLQKMEGMVKTKATGLSSRKKTPEKEKQAFRKHAPDKLLLSTLESFLDKKILAIIKLLSQDPPDEISMHIIRKRLKAIQYNGSLIKTARAEKAGFGFPREEEVQSVARLLGEYHDQRLALLLLDDELNALKIPDDEKQALMNIRMKWQNEKEKKGNEAFHACRTLLQPGSADFD
jgi:CHAD domain-containing protein